MTQMAIITFERDYSTKNSYSSLAEEQHFIQTSGSEVSILFIFVSRVTY